MKLIDPVIDQFKVYKPHIAGELKDWLTTIQHSVHTASLECSYYIDIEFKHQGLLVKNMPEIKLPVSIYYHNNVFFEEIRPAQLPINPYSAPPKVPSPVFNNHGIPPEAMSAPPMPPANQNLYYPSFDLPQNPAPFESQDGYNYGGNFYGQPMGAQAPQFSYEYEDMSAPKQTNPQDMVQYNYH